MNDFTTRPFLRRRVGINPLPVASQHNASVVTSHKSMERGAHDLTRTYAWRSLLDPERRAVRSVVLSAIIAATQAHMLFCLSLQSQFNDYQTNLWGITASDSVNGYTVWGGPPTMGPIDGSIVPCAAGGSLPFLSTDCIAALRNIRTRYPRAWQRYGYLDAFNPLTGWYDSDVLGIDAGITMLMAENQRSAFVWKTFMANPEAQSAFSAVGLK